MTTTHGLMEKRTPLFFVLMLAVALQSCRFGNASPESINPFPDADAYYPLTKGTYIVYDAVKIRFNTNRVHDTSVFQIKETVADTFRTLAGEPAYRLETERRADRTKKWEPDSVRVAIKRKHGLLKYENNMAFVKLPFPFEEGKVWNGNTYNIYPYGEYKIFKIGKPYENKKEGLGFQNTVTVSADTDTLAAIIRWIERYDVYEKNTGLVFKEYKNFEYFNNGDPRHPDYGKNVIVNGSYEKLKFVEKGKK